MFPVAKIIKFIEKIRRFAIFFICGCNDYFPGAGDSSSFHVTGL